ncbi:uncharacterized protein [Antedon mediterranea]|uniref:uncharacterized protein isoform X2 n=1 Tax=Antedon mediterranea TaxID=105859 RepID=UPI003AF5E5C4
MSDTEIERMEETPKQEEAEDDKATESSENKTDDEWELLDAEDNDTSVKEPKTDENVDSSMVVDISVTDEDSEKNRETIEVIKDADADSPSQSNLDNNAKSEPVVDDTAEKQSDDQAKEPEAGNKPVAIKISDVKSSDVTLKPFDDQESTDNVEKLHETDEKVTIAAEKTEDDTNQKKDDTDQKKDDTDQKKDDTDKKKEDTSEVKKEQEEVEDKETIEMAPAEDPALPNLGDVQLLQSELLLERVNLRKRSSGAVGRRPPTKRASWTDGQGRPVSWMFADSAEPKLVDLELPSDDEDEKDVEERKKEEVQTPSKPRIPIGGVPSPMMLPGLADAVKFRKKTPARHSREIGNTRSSENTEVKSPPWAKNILKSPPIDGGLKVTGLSPSWASGSALKHPKPAKDLPEKRPKPVVRPRPKPRPKSIAVMSDLQGQPMMLSQELLQKVERQSLKHKHPEVKKDTETENKLVNTQEKEEKVTVNGIENSIENQEKDKNDSVNESTENKLADNKNNKPTVNILIKTPSVEDNSQSPSPVLEKKLNSDIINAQKKREDKEKEEISKTPQWMDQKKKLPPIPKCKPKPAVKPAKPDRSTVSSQPQWKQDLMRKKKEDEAQGKKKPVVVPQRKTNTNVITTLPDWQQDLAEKVQKKKKHEKPTEKGDEEKNEKEKIPEWKRQAAERAQRRKKLENANPPSNRPSHVDELPHPDETPNWKIQMEDTKTDTPIDKEIIVIKTDDNRSDSDNVVENNKEQSGNIPQWKKELMERKQRSRSLGDVEQTNKKLHIADC